jgi:ActR/RegA family two-component response regulator
MEEGHDRRQPAVVLVACDTPGALELLARLVEREGWRAERAGAVPDALAAAATTLPRVVVVDLRHGGLGSALQLLGRLRGHDDPRVAGTHVVVVEDAGNGQAVLASGADAHVSRPAHVRDVTAAISRAFSTT